MELLIRKGTPADLEPFLQLLQEVRQGMTRKDWFYLDEPEEVRQMLADGTMDFWIAMDHDQLAAAFSVLYPGVAACNYGYDLGFDEQQLMQVVNMDTIAVYPAYRGMGLQRTLMQTAEKAITQRGAKILLCTVHPDNTFSLNNILAQGYSIKCKLPKYGSVRYLLQKDI